MLDHPNYLPIGSISHGTLRTEDLLDSFRDALAELDNPCVDGIMENADLDDDSCYADTENNRELLNSLFDQLNDHCPPYCYFGAHEGDGSDFGCWPCDLGDFDGLRVSDTSEVPADYSGEVLHVNDHGNCTLYAADNGELTEIWSIV